MVKKLVHVIFEKGATTVHFPHSSIDVDSVSLSAVVANHLLFLHCDFLLSPSSSTASLLLASTLAFPAIADPISIPFWIQDIQLTLSRTTGISECTILSL